GWPLVAASRITKYPIRQRVTGSDFIIPLCRLLAADGLSVFLLGSSTEVLKLSSKRLLEIVPGLVIGGTYSPPYGFEKDPRQLDIIDQEISRARPHALFVALGAPKQEIWMQARVQHLPIGVAIGIGATLDFLAGKQRRAPYILQTLGLEWLWRALSDPHRLGRRYLLDIALLPRLVFGQVVRHLITKRNTVRERVLPG
ncbi:MAG: WecB/TagA/CpsF family glycosyltransferase, partial [Rhodomicrobium sp.]